MTYEIETYRPKYNELTPQQQKSIDKHLFTELEQIAKIGDYLISGDGWNTVSKIVDIYYLEEERWKDGGKIKYTVQSLFIETVTVDFVTREVDSHVNVSSAASKFTGYNRASVWTGTLEELISKSKSLISEESIESKEDEEPVSTGISTLDSIGFTHQKKELIQQMNFAKSIADTAKAMLDRKIRELRDKVDTKMKEVKKLSGIIWTLELYLGIKEDIHIIQEGVPANTEEPIRLLQAMSFIDEEVGDPTDGGLDISDIPKFLKWLVTKNTYLGYYNYELLVPYKKSVRILRVRRDSKKYSENPFINSMLNDVNFRTFILIRNGSLLYYISTDMEFGDKLFPSQTELMDLYTSITDEERGWSRRNEKDVMELMDKEILRYKRNLIIMQGLVDRTEVFGKVQGKIKFLDGSSINSGDVELVYDSDANNLISDGAEFFTDWMRDSNQRLHQGSRVLYSPTDYYQNRDIDSKDRFHKMHLGSHIGAERKYLKFPPTPDRGIYLLYEEKTKGELHDAGDFFISYLPDDEVENENGKWVKRKNKVSYLVKAGRDIINYDELTHREIDWLYKMLHDRRLRRNYMSNLRFILGLIKFKEAELAEERPFASLIISATGKGLEEVLDAIHWWKSKNKYCRPLKEDDNKAYRMILSKLK